MEVMNALTGDLQIVAGGLAKAFLVVRYYKFEANKKDGKPKDLEARNATIAQMVDKEKALVKAAEAAQKKNNNSLGSSISASDFAKSEDALAKAQKKKKRTGEFVTFQVQYNPSTLSIGSIGGDTKIFGRQGMGQAGENIVSTINSPIMTTLDCKLIFESINQVDAFVRESEDLSSNISTVGNVFATGQNLYNKKTATATKNNNSIRRKVEALLGCVMSAYTRDIIFAYGNTIFHGLLTGCTVNYKMFNKAGEPILAEVTLKLKQPQTEAFKYDSDRWVKAFDDYFNVEHVPFL